MDPSTSAIGRTRWTIAKPIIVWGEPKRLLRTSHPLQITCCANNPIFATALEMSGEVLTASFKDYLVISPPESKLLSMTAIEEFTLSSLYFDVTEYNNSEVKDIYVASDTFFTSWIVMYTVVLKALSDSHGISSHIASSLFVWTGRHGSSRARAR